MPGNHITDQRTRNYMKGRRYHSHGADGIRGHWSGFHGFGSHL